MADTVWQDKVSGWANPTTVRKHARPRETKIRATLSALVLALKVALSALALAAFLMVGKRPARPVDTAEVTGATRPCWLRQVHERSSTCGQRD
jgi:hypothetical protein